jgi:hypothetical protein
MTTTPISFIPIRDATQSVWRRPASFSFASDITQIPLADSELLLTSHHLPIAIDCLNDHPRVVAVIDPRFQRSPAIGADGQWQKGYLPLALRCLPFRTSGDAKNSDAIEIAVNLPEKDEPGIPLFSSDKSLSPEVRQIAGLLRRLEDGKQQLQKAAEQLLIAGVLTPLHLSRTPDAANSRARSFTVNKNEFSALSNARIALIAKDGFLPIDLATACIFSQRLMATLVSVATGETPLNTRIAAVPNTMDDFVTPLRLEVQIDDSELFSFEQYEKASGTK